LLANLQEESSDGTTNSEDGIASDHSGSTSLDWWRLASSNGTVASSRGDNCGWDNIDRGGGDNDGSGDSGSAARWGCTVRALDSRAGGNGSWSSFRGGWGSSRRGGGSSRGGGTRAGNGLGGDGDTNGQAELVGSLSSLLGIGGRACLQDAGSRPTDEVLVGARALEVGQRATSSLEGWEKAGLSAGWDVCNALGGGNGRDGNEGDSGELHFDLFEDYYIKIIY